MFYPVGSVYETMDSSFDPNEKWGGTWERIKGRVLVGVDENDSDFNTAEKTGGEKTHTLVVSELPQHTHANYAKRTNITINNSGNTHVTCHSSNSGATVGHNIGSTGEGVAHNNLQPYITCYIWKRVK